MQDDHACLRPDRFGLPGGQSTRDAKSELRSEHGRQGASGIANLADAAECGVVGFSVAIVYIVNTGPEGAGPGSRILSVAVLPHGRTGRELPIDTDARARPGGSQAV